MTLSLNMLVLLGVFTFTINCFTPLFHQFQFLERRVITLQSTHTLDSTTSINSSISIIISFENWLAKKTLQDVLSKDDCVTLIKQFKTNETVTNIEKVYNDIWSEVEVKLATEYRSVKNILGPIVTSRLLAAVESSEVYDPNAVRAFLQAPVFELMVGGVLYEAIFEFLQRVDVLGSALNRLPLIGPVRVQFVREFKKIVDAAVGEQLKTFLASYNRVALQRIIQFVLSKENKLYLAKANRGLVDNLLSRPICELFSPGSTLHLKRLLWSAVEDASEKDLLAQVETLYLNYAGSSLRPIVTVSGTLPGVREAFARGLQDFLSSSDGQDARNLLLTNSSGDKGVALH